MYSYSHTHTSVKTCSYVDYRRDENGLSFVLTRKKGNGNVFFFNDSSGSERHARNSISVSKKFLTIIFTTIVYISTIYSPKSISTFSMIIKIVIIILYLYKPDSRNSLKVQHRAHCRHK